MSENRELVRCRDCSHESGLGYDAWCDAGIKKHNINEPIYCDAFSKWNYDKSNEYTDIEINNNGNQIILWKGDNTGQRFDRMGFIRFLNEKL